MRVILRTVPAHSFVFCNGFYFEGPGTAPIGLPPTPQHPLPGLQCPPVVPQVAELAVCFSSLTPVNFFTSLPTPTSQHSNNPISLDY